jgi:ABC-type bacteriocin/lantibiotic exporter with double-glycine peptidase domain
MELITNSEAVPCLKHLFPDESMISFENVSLSYNKDIPVLMNLNLKFFPGRLVAIVGKVGSGKSTLLKSIAAEIPYYEGSIKFKGLPSRSIIYNLDII